jgi:exodeoxyribonuclease VII small subunit
MSKAAKQVAPDSAAGADLPFEEALKKLEAIVQAMEAGDLPLETMMARFEEGMRLSEVCKARLAAAEVRIQQLEKSAGGQVTAKPLTPLNNAPGSA